MTIACLDVIYSCHARLLNKSRDRSKKWEKFEELKCAPDEESSERFSKGEQ